MFLHNFLFLLLCQIFLTSYGHENPCQFPMLKGPCLQSLFRYYYDMETDECKKFTYSGCGGNPNRFIRRQQCRQKCVKDQNKRDTDLAASTSSSRNPVLERIYKAQRNEEQQPQKESQGHLNEDANFALKTSNDVHSSSSSSACPICDPLYGSCVDGRCECKKGFKLRGKICIDVNECLLPNACPEFSNCTNTFGSFRCDCPDGKCDQAAEVCNEAFDRRLADVCDENVKEKRFYFDSDSSTCKEFVFAGCESKARNLFVDSHTCEKICAAKVKQHYRENLVKIEKNDVVRGEIEIRVEKEEIKINEIRKTTTKLPEIEGTTMKKDRGESNPNEDICIKPFDSVLRLECIEATWTEKFFWNHEAKDCEPFWYDTSCDPRDLFDKNFFDTSANCLKRCNSTKTTTFLPITVTSTQAPIVTEKTAVSEKKVEVLDVPKRRNRFTVPTDSWIWETTTRSIDFWSTRSPMIAPNEIPQPPPKDFPQIPPTLVTFPPKISAQKEVEIEVEKVDIKPHDPCLDLLDPKLEEDCKGETWEIRWHFNPQKKSCKRFWWGGCESKSKNFFENAETCKTICGHRFVSESDGGAHFPITQNVENEIVVTTEATRVETRKPMEIVKELSTDQVATTTTTATSTTSTKQPTTTEEHKIWLNADFEESFKHSTFAPIQIHETTEYVQKAVDLAPQETTPTNIAKSFDPCLDPFDVKFESDCSEDNWVASFIKSDDFRSFFDAEKLDCRRFWYGGCTSKSQNLFQDQNSCRLACAHLIPTVHPPSFISLDGVHSNRISSFSSEQITYESTEFPLVHLQKEQKGSAHELPISSFDFDLDHENSLEHLLESFEFKDGNRYDDFLIEKSTTTADKETRKHRRRKSTKSTSSFENHDGSFKNGRGFMTTIGGESVTTTEVSLSSTTQRIELADDLMYFDVLKEKEKFSTFPILEKSDQKLDQASSSTPTPGLDLKIDPNRIKKLQKVQDDKKIGFELIKSDFFDKTTSSWLEEKERRNRSTSTIAPALKSSLNPEKFGRNLTKETIEAENFELSPNTTKDLNKLNSLEKSNNSEPSTFRSSNSSFEKNDNSAPKSLKNLKNLETSTFQSVKEHENSNFNDKLPILSSIFERKNNSGEGEALEVTTISNSAETLKLLEKETTKSSEKIQKSTTISVFDVKEENLKSISRIQLENSTQLAENMENFAFFTPARRTHSTKTPKSTESTKILKISETLNDSTIETNKEKEFFKDSPIVSSTISPVKIKGAKKPQKGEKYEQIPIFLSENRTRSDLTVFPENFTLKRTNKTTVVSPSAFKLKATVTTKIPGADPPAADPPAASNFQEFVKTEEKLGNFGNSVKSQDLPKENEQIGEEKEDSGKKDEFGSAHPPLEHQDDQEKSNSLRKSQDILSKSYNLISEVPKNHDFSLRTHLAVTIAEECLDDFDAGLTRSCMYEKQWKNRYYFDKDARSCRMFWWDGCFSSSRNSFSDEETCKWKCLGAHPKPEGSKQARKWMKEKLAHEIEHY